MPLDVSRHGRTTTISVDGTFDADAIARLRNVLQELRDDGACSSEIVVDLRRARDVPPIALAALVDGGREIPRVRYLGLSQHAARLIGHLSSAGVAG